MAQPKWFLVFTRGQYCQKGKNRQIKEAKYIWPPQLARVCKACQGWQEIICLSHRATKWSKCFYPATWGFAQTHRSYSRSESKEEPAENCLQLFKNFDHLLSEESGNFQLVVPDGWALEWGSLKRSSSERWRLLFRLLYYPKITFQTWRHSRLGGGLIKRESGSSGRAASHHLGEGFRHTQSHITITMGMVMMS